MGQVTTSCVRHSQFKPSCGTGICDLNKSRARRHIKLKLGSKLKNLIIAILSTSYAQRNLHQIFKIIIEKYNTESIWNKQRYGKHKKIMKSQNHRTDAAKPLKKYWRPQQQFYILKICLPTKRTGICYL